MSATRLQTAVPRSLQFGLFLTGVLWGIAARIAAVRAGRGLAEALHVIEWQPVLREGAFLFLLLSGFSTLSWIATRASGVRAINALPKRATAGREWRQGAALGWGLFLLAVLPAVLAGKLRPEFSFTGHDIYVLVPSLLALLLGALAVEAVFRGFLFRQLIGAIGPAAATVVLAGMFALASSFGTFGLHAGARSVQVTFCAGLLFALAYLRTHALWLGWGMRFCWGVMTAVVFGLPLSGSTEYSSVVFTYSHGPAWLTGGAYGPDGSLWTALVLLLGLPALYALTRDYAWNYTHAPIVAGGYPMDVAPPAAHTAMEAAAAAPALVQIAPVTSTVASTLPAAAAELRERETTSVPDPEPR